MTNNEHVTMLRNGVDAWNAWRNARRQTGFVFTPHLAGANLAGAKLYRADLQAADLRGAKMYETDLRGADLRHANLSGADLRGANLHSANLREAILGEADLRRATLWGVNLYKADLRGADLTRAVLQGTVFGATTLSEVKGLDQCNHVGPSIVDFETLRNSGPLPIAFLRGVGLPNNLIEYLPSLLNEAIQFYSCFISYSTKDEDFANRLHADLQNKGVRCWFARHDLPIGGKILDEIDVAIRSRDKVLLVLSEHSIKSDWVEDEVTKGFEEERKRGQIVLFPVRLDDVVMVTNEPWAAKLRARLIGDFRRWKDHDAYTEGFERVMRDLVARPNDRA
jgi:uncharacterized protein YjbI with pentapeptide repeats